MYLESPTNCEVSNCILSLRVNKAVGHDDIPAFFLKIASHTISLYLTMLILYAFNNGIFPENYKLAKVIPIYKSGDKTNPSNYRPISILNCLSKVMEKMIHKRIPIFLNKNILLVNQQYGFQKNVSTLHAFLDIVTACYDNINNKKYTGIFLLTWKKPSTPFITLLS